MAGGGQAVLDTRRVLVGKCQEIDHRVDAEVLNTRLGIYLTKFFFAKTDQKLLGLELRMQDANEDPCEVYFSDYRAVDGRQLPHRIQVYYKDTHYGTFTVGSYKISGN